jgi:hypothetical protein
MTARPLYPRELLGLAYRLTGRDGGRRRPRTVDLRRAVSTAYYALFHGWTWTVATEFLGASDDHRVADVCRWINHTDILHLLNAVRLANNGEISRNEAGAGKHIEPLLPRPIDARLVLVSRAFSSLQQHRHDADYDDRYDVSKELALEQVELTDDALTALWALYADRDAGLLLLLKLGLGGVKVAKTR